MALFASDSARVIDKLYGDFFVAHLSIRSVCNTMNTRCGVFGPPPSKVSLKVSHKPFDEGGLHL